MLLLLPVPKPLPLAKTSRWRRCGGKGTETGTQPGSRGCCCWWVVVVGEVSRRRVRIVGDLLSRAPWRRWREARAR